MAGIRYFANVQGLGTAFQSRQMARAVTFLYKRGLKGAEKVFLKTGPMPKNLHKGASPKRKGRSFCTEPA